MAMQLFVQGAGLVLGSGVAVIAVQATATLRTRDIVASITTAVMLFAVCMGLVARIVLHDGQPGALMRLFNSAYGHYAGYARCAQQLLFVVGMASLTRTAFALLIADAAWQKLASVLFLALCTAAKLAASGALDWFNAVTGVMEIARWAAMVPVLLGVAALSLTGGGDSAGASLVAGSGVTDNAAAMVALCVTALYGLCGMETVVDKTTAAGVSSRSLVHAIAAVLALSSGVYIAVAALTATLVPPSVAQELLDTGNTAQLNDILLQLCLAPMGLQPWLARLVNGVFQGLVFLSIINGVSSLADLNVDCVSLIGCHSPPGCALHRLRSTAAASVCVAIISCAFCVLESAMQLVEAVSAFVVLSHLLTGIAFAVAGPRGRADALLSALHAGVMVLLVAALLFSARRADWARLCALTAAAIVLPLWAAWKTLRNKPRDAEKTL